MATRTVSGCAPRVPVLGAAGTSLLRRTCTALMIVFGFSTAGAAHAAAADDAGALGARHGTLLSQFKSNTFGRPLDITSSETETRITGDIHAELGHPFATTGNALDKPGRWCDIMMLHINTKFCRASAADGATRLQVNIGRKHDQPPEDAYRVDFNYRVQASTPEYLRVALTADSGPLGTRDYRVILEAIPLGRNTTFIHLTYSYAYGATGRIAMQTYLGTLGSNKVGFTRAPAARDGKPAYIGGMRGLVERNTMRYYLAIEAYLNALSAPPQARQERSLQNWFGAIEQYPRQLGDLTREEYLGMKRREFARMRTDT